MPAFFYDFDIGRIGITDNGGKISNLYFENDQLSETLDIRETPLLREAALQIGNYLGGRLREFNLPLAPAGTEFMNRVWTSLCTINYGTTASYREIAQKIGAPNAARAVGLANNRNPIPLIIPCHRVIGADGSLTGYRGGLALKKQLLDMERKNAGF